MNKATIHQIGFAVCLWAFCGLTSHTSGQDRLLQNNGCLYSVEGNCIPRRTTYGYYQTHWRTWPNAPPPRVPKMKKKFRRAIEGSTSLPDAEVPRAKDEASVNPRLPTLPDELAPAGTAAPPSQFELDRATDPFEDDLSPDVDIPNVETPLEDDLDIPPASSSGAVRLDRPSISQSQRLRSTRSSAAAGFTRNPLRQQRASQNIPTHFLPTGPAMMRPVSHEAPIVRRQSSVTETQPVAASNPLRLP